MTEEEFNKRLIALIQNRPGVGGLAGFADIFQSVKGTIVSLGSKLATGVKSIAGGLKNVFTSTPGQKGPSLGQSIFETAGAVYTTKAQIDMAKAQNKAVADQNAAQIQLALAQQGIDVSSAAGQQLLKDVANGGIYNDKGQTLFPAANPGASSASFFGLDLATLQPILIAATGLMALSYISNPPRPARRRRRAKR